ncbi:pathogenesis-related protein STH-21-like [Tripterygium wilfordii]|uniref:pathogenesis-related protein STH-21-like n=1 Tax=Tripterygium wilfordii TaxID=458696 RepID=UPI0018F8466C|nr:pathogenesis-related protein STH-21-like [Tripterygium wilfordii]
MGVSRVTTQTFTTRVTPARMFKALILDCHNICPKLMFSSIKSIEFIQGEEAEVGTIRQLNFTEDHPYKYVKHQIDAIDKEKFVCKYRFIEGDVLLDKLEFITYEIKFEGYGSGGCVCKMKSEYIPKEGVEIQEVDVELGKDRSIGMYEVVEAYLLAHPQIYS